MRRLTLSLTLLLLLPVGLVFGQRLGPKLLVVEPKFDFGYIPQQAKVSHTYWIDNLGTDTLRVFNVRPGCGCTEAPLDVFTAAPNDSLPIEIVFDTGRRSRTQLKSTAVTCNDPTKSRFDLVLSAYVYKDEDTIEPIIITKNSILKLTTDDLGKSFSVKLKNVSKKPLSAELIDYPSELISVRMPSKQVGPGESAEIVVKVNSKLPRKNFNKSFTFELSDEAKTRFTIPLRMAESVRTLGET